MLPEARGSTASTASLQRVPVLHRSSVDLRKLAQGSRTPNFENTSIIAGKLTDIRKVHFSRKIDTSEIIDIYD
jgi:hypothetical protein